MAIRRVTTNLPGEQQLVTAASMDRKFTQRIPRQTNKHTNTHEAPQFGGVARRSTKKALVDIEMDADSDLEDFEMHNQIEKIQNEDSDDAGLESPLKR